MTRLSTYLDDSFKKIYGKILSILVAFLILIYLSFNFYSLKKDIDRSLKLSIGIFASLLFDQNIDQINRFSSVTLENEKLSGIQLISKENGRIVFEIRDERNRFLNWDYCKTSDDSEILRLQYCKNIFSENFWTQIFLCFILLGSLAVLVYLFFKKMTLNVFNQMVADLESVMNNSTESFSSSIEEICRIRQKFMDHETESKVLNERLVFLNLSRRLAHDIKSPIKILENAISENVEARGNNSIKESLVRLRSILNDLLNKTKQGGHQKVFSDYERVNLVEAIKNEYSLKQFEFRDSDVELQIFFTEPDFEIDLWINKLSIQRLFSNLFNNSFESIKMQKGKIIIEISSLGKDINVVFKDNGGGFPDMVIEKLGKTEMSYYKKDGNGLGLSSGFIFFQAINGVFEIYNEKDSACIRMKFPALYTVQKKVQIFHLDDDDYIRKDWQASARNLKYDLVSFKSFSELEKVLDTSSKDTELFIDVELGEKELSGIEVAQKILVKGFLRVNLSTNYEIDDLDGTEGINRIIGKKFPY